MSFMMPSFSGSNEGSNNLEPFPDPFCLPPGTLVELADLTYKNVEDLGAADRVLTRKHGSQPVVAASGRYVEEDLVSLELAGFGKKLPLRLTGNHRVWAIRTKDVRTLGDVEDVQELRADKLQPGDYMITPLPTRKARKSPAYSTYILGMYAAEGCRIRNRKGKLSGTRFSLGYGDENTGVLATLLTQLSAAVCRPVVAYTPPARQDCRWVTVYDKQLAKWLGKTCQGNDATTKTLSDNLLSYSNKNLHAFFAGWLDGDGQVVYRSEHGISVSIRTASKGMAMQGLRIANAAGLTPSLLPVEVKNSTFGGSGISYQLSFGIHDLEKLAKYSKKLQNLKQQLNCKQFKATARNRRTYIQDGYVCRRIRKVTREAYAGYVYNIEVANDHSYIANGVIVSNCDYASTAMPTSLENAFRWCEYIMLANGVYRSAIDRVISYFITDIDIQGTDRESKERYTDFLNDTLGIHSLLRTIALDYLTYGNFFASVVIPFRRNLSCPGCGFEAPLKQIHGNEKFSFSWSDGEFSATCPFCGYGGKWTHIDRRSTEEDDIIVKRWNIHEIDLIWDPYTDQVSQLWKIPPYYKQYIARGTLFHLERAPWEVLQAIKHNKHIQFNKDVIYHGKENTLSGILNKGWGISRILTNFRQAWYVQVLHRYNEAIGLDYIIPFRLLTPEPRTGGAGNGESTDPLFTADLGGFVGQIQNMLRQRRRDPTQWFAMPFPVRYQALGAEASQMAPYQLMDQAMDTLLSSVGVPVEFYKGSLTVQAAPAALRLMESNWSHLTRVLNNFLQWLVNKISIALNWDEVTIKLERPSHADDLNRQLAKLQLMMGQQISQTTGLKSVGLDFNDEQKRMLEEQKFVAEESQTAQEEMEAAGLGDQLAQGQVPGMGAPPQGGDPSQGGAAPQGGQAGPAGPAGQPVDPIQAVLANLPGKDQSLTPPELESIAQTISQQIFALPSSQRIQSLRQLKQRNVTIHSLVKSFLEDLDEQGAAKGRQMQQQAAQQTQQQSMAPPPPTGGQAPGGA